MIVITSKRVNLRTLPVAHIHNTKKVYTNATTLSRIHELGASQISMWLFVLLWVVACCSEASTPATGDVVVYGATAPGCVAAIAAARSGAKRVLLASPYNHVGGMTTGGIMHADVANESTVGGVTLEFFLRVRSHYKPAPEAQHYACVSARCVMTNGDVPHSSSDPKCSGACSPLAPTEWLAVRRLSSLSDGNTTLTVHANTFIKKTERLCGSMSPPDPALCRRVADKQVLQLQKPATILDPTYFLVDLEADSPTALARLVAATASERAEDRPPLHPGAPPGWLYESKVAELVLEEMLAEANVTILRGLKGLASATRSGTTLQTVTSDTGVVLAGGVWIDGSYEGDLAAVGGAEMVWGRESKAQYNESGAGRRPASLSYKQVSPYWADGSVIPHVSNAPLAPIGGADDRMQVYTFRLCITDSPGNRAPFTKPEGYNASEWEFWRRLYLEKPPADLRAAGLGCIGPIPNNYSDCVGGACIKCDMLGMQHGTDMLNGAWLYPNASTAEREQIREAHIQYMLGLLWFWSTDPAVGASLHKEMAEIGYCTDEYTGDSGFGNDPPNWPYQVESSDQHRQRALLLCLCRVYTCVLSSFCLVVWLSVSTNDLPNDPHHRHHHRHRRHHPPLSPTLL